MKYAVIKVGGSQYKVSENSQLSVDRLSLEEGSTDKIENVLFFTDGKELKIGKPQIKGAFVKVKVLKNYLGEKLDIFKFKAKTGYRRKTGFRPQKTLLLVEEISA